MEGLIVLPNIRKINKFQYFNESQSEDNDKNGYTRYTSILGQ